MTYNKHISENFMTYNGKVYHKTFDGIEGMGLSTGGKGNYAGSAIDTLNSPEVYSTRKEAERVGKKGSVIKDNPYSNDLISTMVGRI